MIDFFINVIVAFFHSIVFYIFVGGLIFLFITFIYYFFTDIFDKKDTFEKDDDVNNEKSEYTEENNEIENEKETIVYDNNEIENNDNLEIKARMYDEIQRLKEQNAKLERENREIETNLKQKNKQELYSDRHFDNPLDKGLPFEHDCKNLLERYGYDVIWRGLELGKKDGGIDLIATKDNIMFLVQCKNYKKSAYIDDKLLKVFYADTVVFIENNDVNNYTICRLFVTKYPQLAYNGQKWIEDKPMNYYSFEEFEEVLR